MKALYAGGSAKKGGDVDTEGVLKLDKCPKCGLLFPVGAVHVCEETEPVALAAPPVPRNHNKLGWWIMGVLIAIPVVAVAVGGGQFLYNVSQIGSTPTTWSPTAYRALDYDHVAIGMTYREVASVLQSGGEVESTYTDSHGTRMDIKWSRGGSYISVTLFNGAVTDKYAKGLAFQ